MLSPCDLNDCLISQSKLPEGDDIAITCFDIVFYYIALGCILYLLLLLTLSAHLKGFPSISKSLIRELKCTKIVQINVILRKTLRKCTLYKSHSISPYDVQSEIEY